MNLQNSRDSLPVEYEVKVLDSDFSKVKQKLKAMGGVMITPRRLMRRSIFDRPDGSFANSHIYLRVRDEGGRCTTTFKYTAADSGVMSDVKELDVEVSNYDTMCQIYRELGFVKRQYQETYRESWKIDSLEVEFDEWPWLTPYFEIEGSSEDKVRELVEELGYSSAQTTVQDVSYCYQLQYEISRADVLNCPIMKFGDKLPDAFKEKQT